MFRTLRFRLMAWNTGVLLLIVLPALIIVREDFRLRFYTEFDRVLSGDINEVKLTLLAFYPQHKDELYNELKFKAQGHKQQGWFVQLFDARGELEYSSRTTPADLPVLETSQDFRKNVNGYRLVQEKVKGPAMPPVTARVGASLDRLDEDVTLLTRTLIGVGVLISLIAPLGGYWLSGRATRPLAKIIHKTSRLRPSNLDERLPLRGTGDELDQLSQTINGLLNRIALYIEQKGDFLANAAHELRSPLAAIKSTVEVALNSDRSAAEYVALLNDVMEECTSLAALVNQLLLLAEGDVGRLALHTETVRLDRIVRKSIDMFNGVAESQGVTLRDGNLMPVEVHGGESYLRQLINNLLDNAIKYTPEGGSVGVEVAAEPGSNRVRLSVSDTGIGIATEDLPRIFERFYRTDKSRRHEGIRRGSGLGLSICHSIVEAMQGEIKVDSTPGKGSTFNVYLPGSVVNN